MARALKYIVDDSGQKTSVLVPIKVWDEMNLNYRRLEQKLAVFSSLQKGLKEVKSSKKSGRKLPTLNGVLK